MGKAKLIKKTIDYIDDIYPLGKFSDKPYSKTKGAQKTFRYTNRDGSVVTREYRGNKKIGTIQPGIRRVPTGEYTTGIKVETSVAKVKSFSEQKYDDAIGEARKYIKNSLKEKYGNNVKLLTNDDFLKLVKENRGLTRIELAEKLKKLNYITNDQYVPIKTNKHLQKYFQNFADDKSVKSFALLNPQAYQGHKTILPKDFSGSALSSVMYRKGKQAFAKMFPEEQKLVSALDDQARIFNDEAQVVLGKAVNRKNVKTRPYSVDHISGFERLKASLGMDHPEIATYLRNKHNLFGPQYTNNNKVFEKASEFYKTVADRDEMLTQFMVEKMAANTNTKQLFFEHYGLKGIQMVKQGFHGTGARGAHKAGTSKTAWFESINNAITNNTRRAAHSKKVKEGINNVLAVKDNEKAYKAAMLDAYKKTNDSIFDTVDDNFFSIYETKLNLINKRQSHYIQAVEGAKLDAQRWLDKLPANDKIAYVMDNPIFDVPGGVGPPQLPTVRETVARLPNPIIEPYNKGGSVDKSIGGIVGDKNKGFAIDDLDKNKVGTLASMLAGIGSGLIDIPKGAFVLGTALMDLGFGTTNAAKVEAFFDDMTTLDEKAKSSFAGNLTKIMVNLGIPGGFAMKAGAQLATKALTAKRFGNYFKLTDPRMVEKYKTSLNAKGRLFATLGAAGAAGVADGIFVGDPEHIGTIGDMFGGPTQLLENDENSASREVINRMKFGLDTSFLVGLIGGSGSAIKSVIKRRNELETNNDVIDKILGGFRPRGAKPQRFFDVERKGKGVKDMDMNRAQASLRGLDKHIDAIFPHIKGPKSKLTEEGRRVFMDALNKTLLSGEPNINSASGRVEFGDMDKTMVENISKLMKGKGASKENIDGVFQSFYDIRSGWGEMFSSLGVSLKGNKESFKAFGEAFGKKFKDYLGTNYRIFSNKSVIPMLNYKPAEAVVEKAMKVFMQAAKDNGSPISRETAETFVNRAIETAAPAKNFSVAGERSAGAYFKVPDFFANKTTLAGVEGIGKETVALNDLAPETKKIFQELFGKISNPRDTILTGTGKLSSITRRNEQFQLLKNEDELITAERQAWIKDPKNAGLEMPGSLRGFFRETELDAINDLGKNIKEIDLSNKNNLLDEAGITNPLHGKYAEKAVADAVMETAQVTADPTWYNQIYNSLILYPKGVSQLAKTVLSPITHARNFISAGAFATANGLIPGLTVSVDDSVKAFREAFGGIQTNIPGTRTAIGNKRYQDLLRLNVVDSNVRKGDLDRLLNDVKFGETVNSSKGLRTLLSPFSKLKKWTQDMYVAEDDFWKITSFALERGRLKTAYEKYGMKFTDDLLDNQAAEIVRNNIPNYSMVSEFIKGLRKLPFGNFVSFPAEIYRTSHNIVGRALKEINMTHTLDDGRVVRPLRGIGMKRLFGFTATVGGIPYGTVKAMEAIHDVTEDEMQALRRFVPDWSKNSTLVPIRDEEGDLKYIDFSHANAYDALIRPLNGVINGIQRGIAEEDIMKGFTTGLIEATAETASPFISESIWTQALADIVARQGRTREGRRLWTDETPGGDKFAAAIKHLSATVVPGSLPALKRMSLAVREEVDEYGRTYEFLDEALGIGGFRAVKVDPINAMKFKIAEFRTGVNNARREFTGPLLKGGPITKEQVVDQFQVANEALFKVQKRMFDDYYAARILGSSVDALANTFQDRMSDKQVLSIRRGVFTPFIPSENIEKAFRDNARAIGQPDAYQQAKEYIKRLIQRYNQRPLGGQGLPQLDNPFKTSLGQTIRQPLTNLMTSPLQNDNLAQPLLPATQQNTLQKGQQVFGSNDLIFGS